MLNVMRCIVYINYKPHNYKNRDFHVISFLFLIITGNQKMEVLTSEDGQEWRCQYSHLML